MVHVTLSHTLFMLILLTWYQHSSAKPTTELVEASDSSDTDELSPTSEQSNEANSYNVIMPDYYDHHPAESMQYQNFEQFHDSEMAAGSDLGMDETQFLESTPVRDPQPLSAEERRIRQKVQHVDLNEEKKALLKLKKGTTVPRGKSASQWDQFDYDLYSVNSGDNKEYIYG